MNRSLRCYWNFNYCSQIDLRIVGSSLNNSETMSKLYLCLVSPVKIPNAIKNIYYCSIEQNAT